MYNYPHMMFFKLEKVLGFLLLVIGIFALLKLFAIIDPEFLIPSEYMVWVTTLACTLFGLALLTHRQHHRFY